MKVSQSLNSFLSGCQASCRDKSRPVSAAEAGGGSEGGVSRSLEPACVLSNYYLICACVRSIYYPICGCVRRARACCCNQATLSCYLTACSSCTLAYTKIMMLEIAQTLKPDLSNYFKSVTYFNVSLGNVDMAHRDILAF